MLDELDRYLGIDHNINYWSDDGVSYAHELLDSLGEPGWTQLEMMWKQRPVDWQARLADAAFESDKPRAADLLVQMVKSPNVDVAVAAADSLLAKEDAWIPDASLRDDLERLAKHTEGLRHSVVVRLLARISA